MIPARSARLPHACLLLLLGLAGLWSSPATAELKRIVPGGQPTFLRAAQAFQLLPHVVEGGLALEFRVAPGYYLYRDRFRFTAEGGALTLGAPAFSADGEWKDDPTFGRVRVHHEDITVTLPLQGRGRLAVRWQGCADAGLCYPPQDQLLEIRANGVVPVAAAAPGTGEKPITDCP